MPRGTPRLLSLVMALLLALVLGGCGGDSKPTREEVREKRINDPVRRDSVSARVGDLRLLTVRIERPEGVHATGSNSALFLTLANSGAAADSLVAVSSVDARSVVQREGAEAPAPSIDIPVPEGDVVSMQSPYGLHLELVDLKRDLGKRTFVPVTFRFADAGDVTVQVFVSGVDRQVVPSPSASGGG
ncbi:MAG: copper chaperone PCu(A)C [Marmoricola sp.]